MNVSEKSFQHILQTHPSLCASGLVSPDLAGKLQIDFNADRRRLERSFAEFAACCDWLLDCIPLKHVSFVSPISNELTAHLKEVTGASVANGALIAAVIHMRIPHHHLPDSPNLRVGISRRSPALAGEGGR